MTQLALFPSFTSTTPSFTSTATPKGNNKGNNKWKYFYYLCFIAERKIHKLLKKFSEKNGTNIYDHISYEEIREIARSAVVDLLYKYQYNYIAPSLAEKYTIRFLKRFFQCEKPFIVCTLPKEFLDFLGL